MLFITLLPLSEEISEMERLGEKKPVIQFVGRYGPEKGLNRILESFAACVLISLNGYCVLTVTAWKRKILAVEKYLAQLDPETAQRVELGGAQCRGSD